MRGAVENAGIVVTNHAAEKDHHHLDEDGQVDCLAGGDSLLVRGAPVDGEESVHAGSSHVCVPTKPRDYLNQVDDVTEERSVNQELLHVSQSKLTKCPPDEQVHVAVELQDVDRLHLVLVSPVYLCKYYCVHHQDEGGEDGAPVAGDIRLVSRSLTYQSQAVR